jgi:hypothetical protein
MRQDTIFVSQQSAQRFIWEKIEEWQWRGGEESPMSRAMACHGRHDKLDRLLDNMTRHEIEAMILHERGEAAAGQQLGPRWEEMLLQLSHKPSLVARALRDLLADTQVLLPALLEQGNIPSLHFYFANYTGIRRRLFPEAVEAYHKYIDNNKIESISDVVYDAADRWQQAAVELLAIYQAHGEAAKTPLESLISEKYPL